MKTFSGWLWLAVACLMAVPSVVLAGADIALKDRATPRTSVVRLGDVATIVTADRQLARRLAALPLMPAPAPGTEQFLRVREIEDLLAAHGEDLNEIRVEGPQQVSIVVPGSRTSAEVADASSVNSGAPSSRQAILRSGQIHGGAATLDEATAGQLRNEVESIISRYLNAQTAQTAAWHVSCNINQRHLSVLDAAASPPVCSGGRLPWTGRQRFVISFDTAAGAVQLPIYAEVGLPMPVVIAVQPIQRGDVITAADIELQNLDEVPPSSARRSPIDAIEKLIGKEARQAIRAGDIVFTDQVQAPIVVKRGEVITVVSAGGGIRVRTTARARDDATIGELLQVESLETRERYDVRVTGRAEATVFVPAPSPPVEPLQPIETARR